MPKKRRSGPRGLSEPRTDKEKQSFALMDLFRGKGGAHQFEEVMRTLKVPSRRRPGLVARWLYDHRGGWDASRDFKD